MPTGCIDSRPASRLESQCTRLDSFECKMHSRRDMGHSCIVSAHTNSHSRSRPVNPLSLNRFTHY